MSSIMGIEKFFIKSWEQWSGDYALVQFCNNETALELVDSFVDFEVHLFEINLEKCEVTFYSEWDDLKKDYTITKTFKITNLVTEEIIEEVK